MSTEATATGTGTKPTGTLSEAASAFEAILSRDEETAGTQESNEAQAPKEEAQAPAEEADQQEAQATEQTAEESETEGSDEQAAPTKLYTVRVDGKDEQVQESELIAGYQRHKDYTQKTQAAASERKELAQTKAQLQNERSEYANLLPQLRKALEMAAGQEPNWEALREKDPANAAIEWQRFQERKAQIAVLQQEEQKVAAKQAEADAELRNQILIEEQQKLLSRPELAHWKDQTKAAADAAAIGKMLEEAGFSGDELNIYDHRSMVVAWKAAQYDRLLAQQNAAKKSVAAKVQNAPVAKPGGGVTKVKGEAEKASERLAKTGSVHDAARYFFHKLS